MRLPTQASCYAQRPEKTNEPKYQKKYPNEDSNFPAIPRGLIRVLVGRMKKLCNSGLPKCAQWRFWSDCANAQSDLNIRWVIMSDGTLAHVAAQNTGGNHFLKFCIRKRVIISYHNLTKLGIDQSSHIRNIFVLFSRPTSTCNKLMTFFLIFPENRVWYFMQINYVAYSTVGVNLHEMSKPVLEKKKK